jgi:hypothetical protein
LSTTGTKPLRDLLSLLPVSRATSANKAMVTAKVRVAAREFASVERRDRRVEADRRHGAEPHDSGGHELKANFTRDRELRPQGHLFNAAKRHGATVSCTSAATPKSASR